MGKSLISSPRTTAVLLVIFAVSMAAATFIEKIYGTPAANAFVYHNPLFFLLLFFLVINFIALSVENGFFRKGKIGYVVVHSAFIVIMAGALTSHIFGREGFLHLREGETSHSVTLSHSITSSDAMTISLPFEIELIKFTLKRYPGSNSPSSYESLVRVHDNGKTEEHLIAMNRVLDYRGYRFFQSSFDTDEKGSILSVNQDVAGRNITYAGYILLGLGFILCFADKKSRIRFLIKKLNAAVLLFFIIPVSLQAQNRNDIYELFQKHNIPVEHAEKLGALPVQSPDGRIEPANTFASEILRKLHHSDKVGNLSPDRFLLSVMMMPDMWQQVPFIYVKNKDLSRHYGLGEKLVACVEVFDDNGRYRLQSDVDAVFAKSPSARSKFDKDLLKLDEQIHIFSQLAGGEMLKLFPAGGNENHAWTSANPLLNEYLLSLINSLHTNNWQDADRKLQDISDFQKENSDIEINQKRINAELLYNKLNIFSFCKKFYFVLGAHLLVFAFVMLFKLKKTLKTGVIIQYILIGAVLAYHLFGIALRWYIAGYAPWSNAYETMVYVAFVTVAAGLIFARQSAITAALATLAGGVMLFVSGLNWLDPQITPLVPVLKSPWLMLHVAIIVAAYGFFGISFLLGITSLILSAFRAFSPAQRLTIINELSLWLGLALMTAGTFIGAVWANESWGRYWGWDPKETWALITIVVYAVVVHLRLVNKYDSPKVLNWASIIAFASVLMTYFGVNCYFTGMHTYGV